MNRQYGCRIVKTDGLFEITTSYGDQFVYRIIEDEGLFLIQNRVDERVTNHLYSKEDFTWHTQAVRRNYSDSEAWLRHEYSEEAC